MLKKKFVVMMLLILVFQITELKADKKFFVVTPPHRPRRVYVIKECKEKESDFSKGFLGGMLFDRFLTAHPLIAVTAVTAFTAACMYALLSSHQEDTSSDHTVVYVEEEEETPDVIYVIRS